MKLIDFLKGIFSRAKKSPKNSAIKVGPYQHMRAVWGDVTSGMNFKKYSPPSHHERNFLQALQHQETLKLMAQQVSNATGSRVMLASAFIDGTPTFTWTPKGKSSSVNGEIGDILLVSKVYDTKGVPKHYASFLQAKVTHQSNDVNRTLAGVPIGDSTAKELGLYEHWPPVRFKGQRKGYNLNTNNLSWPFAFSHFLTISEPITNTNGVVNPRWDVSEQILPNSPFSVFSKPMQSNGALSFLKWLRGTACPSLGLTEEIDIASPKNDFDHLVVDVLANLVERQSRERVGHSGGVLIQHGITNIQTFGLLQFGDDLIQASAFPTHLGERTRQIPSGSIRLPTNVPQAEYWSDEPMLLMYLVVGPEGVQSKEHGLIRPGTGYPGEGIF